MTSNLTNADVEKLMREIVSLRNEVLQLQQQSIVAEFKKNALRQALYDAVNSEKGIVPESAQQFYRGSERATSCDETPDLFDSV